MRIAVCESAPEMMPGDDAWISLSSQVRKASCDLFLLNEMPFGLWVAGSPEPDTIVLNASRETHQAALEKLGELGTETILGTHPVQQAKSTVNEAYIWHNGRVNPQHTKQYFPQEEGYYEASWFRPGTAHFRLGEAAGLQVGFLICTEVMFNEWARYYGRAGAQIIAVPRAVGASSLRRWKTALSMAAIVSGCYVISSNRGGTDSRGQVFGGSGWIFNPDGDCLAETSPSSAVVSAEIDPDMVTRAQQEYPCYVSELD